MESLSKQMRPAQGGTYIFSCIRRLGSFFFGGGGVKIFKFNIFLGFQKNKYFLGYEDFMDIFLGHHKIGLYLRVISIYILGSFLKVKVQKGG